MLPGGDTLRAGYISSLQPYGDSTVVALVNGLKLEDAESLEIAPLASGGILISHNRGATWELAHSNTSEPYFLGMVQSRLGDIIASYTTLVRDTVLQPRDAVDIIDEKLSHRMEDRVVIRSTDNGSTWTEVYRTPINRGFRLLGGDGVRLKDGRLLLITVDGVLESTDDGGTWTFHEHGIQDNVGIISLFTNDEGSSVYYCTDRGLYRNNVLTHVADFASSVVDKVLEAKPWSAFLADWNTSNAQYVSITDVLGHTSTQITIPSSGLYILKVRTNGSLSAFPIYVTGE